MQQLVVSSLFLFVISLLPAVEFFRFFHALVVADVLLLLVVFLLVFFLFLYAASLFDFVPLSNKKKIILELVTSVLRPRMKYQYVPI